MNQWSKKTLAERFWVHVNKKGPIVRPELGRCWTWTGARVSNRYGQIRANGKCCLAHRVAWFLKTGSWPKNNALHRCDNEQCVRFSHLFDGTQLDNVHDMHLKRRDKKNPRRGEAVVTSKLTCRRVKQLRALYKTGCYFQKHLARKFGVSQTLISHVISGKSWRHV